MEGTTSLIHLINELHDISTSCGQNLDINLPQIAVVGSQSSGKSSVLDGIVGKYVISFQYFNLICYKYLYNNNFRRLICRSEQFWAELSCAGPSLQGGNAPHFLARQNLFNTYLSAFFFENHVTIFPKKICLSFKITTRALSSWVQNSVFLKGSKFNFGR